MKKKQINALLSFVLAFSLVLGQPMPVFSAELTDVPQSEASIEDTVSDGQPAATVSENEADATAETVSDNEAVSTETTVSDNEAVPSEETVSDNVYEGDLLQTLSAEKQTALMELGFKPMRLTEAMIEEKAELAPVVEAIPSMKSGEDYIENEIVYMADTEEEALKIAECYGGTLVRFSYGVAIVSIPQPVSSALKIASDKDMPLPAVYPNIVYTTYDTADTSEDPSTIKFADMDENTDTDDKSSEESEISLTVVESDDVYALKPTDPNYKDQWFHTNMKTVEAWDASKGKGIEVAVIDTGVDYNHPDLAANISDHIDVISPAGGPGADGHGHGTHCAGIIASLQNDIGGVGVAPEAKIYSIKALDDNGSGATAYTIMGIIAATARNVDVISMSLGGICYDALAQKAVNNAASKGIVLVAAAGNEGVSQKSYPAAYDNVISVAATTEENDLAYFSNFGSWVDIAAPGYEIYSTVPGGYDWKSGTSMACPAVAGTVALILGNSAALKGADNSSTPTKVKKILLDSAGYQYAEGAYSNYGIYPLIDAEAATYSVDSNVPQTPTIKFSTGAPAARNVVLAGEDAFFTFETTTPHAKIYYTLNGSKPTSKTGRRYYPGGHIYMNASGKFKIQAVAVIGDKISKPFSQTYTFDVKAEQLYPVCNENMTCGIGKSIQLNVSFYPYYTSNQKLEWSSSDTTNMIKVSNTGKVTCDKKATAGTTAVITAKTTDGSNKECKITVKASNDMISDLTLKQTSVKMSYHANKKEIKMDGYVYSFQLEPVNGGGVTTNQYLYKSSNPKVAYVDDYGYVYARGKGNAKITVTANDGSGKSAVCNVTVVTPVYRIRAYSSTGFSGGYSDSSSVYEIPIATGCSITMKTVINNNSSAWYNIASNKALDWTSSNSSLISAKNGKIKCSKNATPGASASVTVTAKDGFGAYITIKFLVVDKIQKIGVKFNGKDYLNSVTVKDFQVGRAMYDFKFYVSTAHNTLNVCNTIRTETSNRDVVYRYYDEAAGGVVIAATKPGSSKITYTIPDGSNKKFTVNFKVIAAK